MRLGAQISPEVQGSAGLEENLGAVTHRSIVTRAAWGQMRGVCLCLVDSHPGE